MKTIAAAVLTVVTAATIPMLAPLAAVGSGHPPTALARCYTVYVGPARNPYYVTVCSPLDG